MYTTNRHVALPISLGALQSREYAALYGLLHQRLISNQTIDETPTPSAPSLEGLSGRRKPFYPGLPAAPEHRGNARETQARFDIRGRAACRVPARLLLALTGIKADRLTKEHEVSGTVAPRPQPLGFSMRVSKARGRCWATPSLDAVAEENLLRSLGKRRRMHSTKRLIAGQGFSPEAVITSSSSPHPRSRVEERWCAGGRTAADAPPAWAVLCALFLASIERWMEPETCRKAA